MQALKDGRRKACSRESDDWQPETVSSATPFSRMPAIIRRLDCADGLVSRKRLPHSVRANADVNVGFRTVVGVSRSRGCLPESAYLAARQTLADREQGAAV